MVSLLLAFLRMPKGVVHHAHVFRKPFDPTPSAQRKARGSATRLAQLMAALQREVQVEGKALLARERGLSGAVWFCGLSRKHKSPQRRIWRHPISAFRGPKTCDVHVTLEPRFAQASPRGSSLSSEHISVSSAIPATFASCRTSKKEHIARCDPCHACILPTEQENTNHPSLCHSIGRRMHISSPGATSANTSKSN